jgi:hypothetical protein
MAWSIQRGRGQLPIPMTDSGAMSGITVGFGGRSKTLVASTFLSA